MSGRVVALWSFYCCTHVNKMANRTHSRQKSDDSKLAFELDDIQSNLSEENVNFSRPKINFRHVASLARWGSRSRERLLYLSGKAIEKTNLTVLSIIVLFLALVLPLSLATMTYFVYPVNVDISLQSFEIPSQNASLNEDAYSVARRQSKYYKDTLSNRARRSADLLPDPWPMPKDDKGKKVHWYKHTQYRSKWNIDLIYLPKNSDRNIFTVEALSAAHRVEQNIMKFPGFIDFCWKWKIVRLDPILSNKYNACTPPISLLDFFFPTKNLGMTFFDGQGNNLTERTMNKTLQFLFSKQFTYWFVDNGFSVQNRKSSFLRAQIKFGYPLKGYQRSGYSHGTMLKEQDAKFNGFLDKFVEYLEMQSNE